MKTLILTTKEEDLLTAAKIIKDGGLVALPTETVYGLSADALNSDAVKNVFKAKGRPADNPLIVHIANKSDVDKITTGMPDNCKRLTDKYWPGPLTVILPKKDIIPNVTSGGLNSVAVRLPKNPVIRKVIELSGCFIAAPSANISGRPSPTTFAHVKEDMEGKIEAIVDGGNCEIGVESTVVSFLGEHPRLLRPGGVTAEQLKEILPDLIIDEGVLGKAEKALCPGMKYKHYAPKANVYMVTGESNKFCAFANLMNIPAICLKEDEQKLKVPYITLGEKAEQNLFSALRKADEKGYKTLLAHAPENRGVGLAINNRLIRSSGFNTVSLPFVVGLTGPSGVGKTTAANVAKDLGFTVIDCDEVAHRIVPTLLSELECAFGEDIITDGRLSRRALAKKAFKNKKETEKLNAITLPPILAEIKKLIAAANTPFILLDGATLIESGGDKLCDKVFALYSGEAERKKRFTLRDKLTEAEATARLGAAKQKEFYIKNGATVINNDGTEQDLIATAKEIFLSYVKEKTKWN